MKENPLPHQLTINSATPTRGLVTRDDKGQAFCFREAMFHTLFSP